MRNLAKIVWFVILATLTTIIGYLIFSGNIKLYLAPTMIPVVSIGWGILVILLIYFVSSVFNATHNHSNEIRLYNIVFLIPLVLFLTATPTLDTVMALPNQNVDIVYEKADADMLKARDGAMGANPHIAVQAKPESATVISESTSVVLPEELPSCLFSEKFSTDRKPDQFSEVANLPTGTIENHTITLVGFVYKDDSFPENTILISRLMISCCIADASIVGYYIKVDNPDMYEINEWIEVTGTVIPIVLMVEGQTLALPILSGGVVTRTQALSLDDCYIYVQKGRLGFK